MRSSKKINISGSEDEKVLDKGVSADSSSPEIENSDTSDNGEKSENEKTSVRSVKSIRKLSGFRIFGMVLIGIISSLVIAGVVWGLYYNYIRYPEMAVYDEENSGLGAINEWVLAINTLDNDEISGITGSGSYIAKEVEYANGKDYKLDFIKKVVGTVSYEPSSEIKLNKYGNPLLDRNDNVVYGDSLVNDEGEKVTIHYIDYSRVELDKDRIKDIMEEVDLHLNDVDYSNKLVEVFCRYMTSLEDDEIPLVSLKYVPSLVKSGEVTEGEVNYSYYMSSDEDVYLDRVLFSSEEFHDLLHRFSLVAGGGSENPEWAEWNDLSEEEKSNSEEPERYFDELQPTEEWVAWSNKTSDEKKSLDEPIKYDELSLMCTTWCGSYYLLNEYSEVDEEGNKVITSISAEVGDGSFENPAGLNTNVVTSIYINETDENGNTIRVAKPIRIRLVDYKVSQDAIDYFEGKDERNRGFDVKSEIQYTFYSIEVTNLSDSKITIYDDSSLSDRLANMSHRTGVIYGLQDSVTLEPYETGVIESWGCSTELNKKYLVWGKNFQRDEDVVWFRVLAGNVDDPSEDKGVTLNNSRYEDAEEVEE